MLDNCRNIKLNMAKGTKVIKLALKRIATFEIDYVTLSTAELNHVNENFSKFEFVLDTLDWIVKELMEKLEIIDFERRLKNLCVFGNDILKVRLNLT